MKNIIIRNSNRFKSVFAQVNMLLPLTAKDMSKNALLAMMLKKSNSKYKTERELERKLAELYNTSFGAGVGKVSNAYDITFGIEILNVKYTGKEALEQAVDILYSAICEPNFVDGKFDVKTFELEKSSLMERIAEEKDNKKKYALDSLEREMFKGSDYGYPLYGTMEDVEKITNEELVKHYYDVISKAEIVVATVGNLENMDGLAEDIYARICGKCGKHTVDIKPLVEQAIANEIETKIEEQDINQSIICIGARIKDVKTEDVYKARLFDNILGGTPAAKLFQNVREKESLAYFAKSMYNMFASSVCMFAGIAPEKYEKAKEVMLKQLEDIKAGNVSDIEFNAAKENLISAYKEKQDSKGGQAKGLFSNEIYFGRTVDFDEMIEEISKLTLDDVVEIANRVVVTNIFLLGGKADV